ncbi:NYN domain-containing protein [Embleya sp. NPDC050154]|uniref:NYN domain-containing protein n=1 Tax=Embleya sp. NPDC050154 TaxID=3363988 RepID=UPI0037948E62
MSGPDTRADEVTPAHAAEAAEAVPAAEPDLDAQPRAEAETDPVSVDSEAAPEAPVDHAVDPEPHGPAAPAAHAHPAGPASAEADPNPTAEPRVAAGAVADACAEPGAVGADPERGDPQVVEPEVLSGPLPEAVRVRVISVAADALGTMTADEVPGPLRRFARFTHQRRAKFAATPLAAALENDPVFRQRIAERFRKGLPEISEALEAGKVPAAADPLDVAAAAYLLRPRGWVRLIETAGDAAKEAAADRAEAEAAETLSRLEHEVGVLRAASKTEHERLRAELETARKEADHLRRQVRGLQGSAKHEEKEARRARSELDAVRVEAQAAVAAAEKEARRLRGRVAEVESALEASRRAAREGRSMEDTRVRLLLDTVLEAAQGLRRELALPPVGIRPADMVDAVVPGASGIKDIAQRALEGDDPALLDQLLALPQAHLVIDGYNVTKTGYPTLALNKQRDRLVGGLTGLAAQTGCEVTCVFDGAQLDAPVLLAPARGVRVMFSKPGETADELIRRLVRAEPPGRPVVVVSTDREVAEGVRKAGARPVPSTMLLRRLTRG